jgi:uncharacterized protein
MIQNRFTSVLSSLVEKQRCPHKLALSFAVGTYIAFSPYVGLHSALVFLLSWLFSLECAAAFAAAWLINNPWTMLPIYAFTYNVGECVLGSWCGINTAAYNPSLPVCMVPLASWLVTKTGLSHISLWSFMLGGNLVGLCAAFIMYPLIKPLFKKLIQEKNKKSVPQEEMPIL